MAPLNETSQPMQLALLVMLEGPLYLHAGENCWRPENSRLVIDVKPATVEALLRRGSVYFARVTRAGKSWQTAKLTPKGGWYARTVKRKREAEAAQAKKTAAYGGLVPRLLTPSIQPGANDA